MSCIQLSSKEIARKISPYGEIERGVRKSKPKDENGLVQYIWRHVRFCSGENMHMPTTSYFWLQDWVDDQDIDANVCGVFDEKGKDILDEVDQKIEEVMEIHGLDSDKAAKRWSKAGLF